jgi:hypothetical protein
MSQAYNQPPSEIYEVKGAAGLFFDKGIYNFGRYVENEVERAGQDALNASFARSQQQRAFARCMGDDMSTSTAGFADPYVAATRASETEGPGEVIMSGY